MTRIFTDYQGQQISIYMAYPTPERIQRLRDLAKAWDETDRMKEERYKKVAKKKEVELALASRSEKKLKRLEMKWKLYQNRLAQKEKNKKMSECIKAIANAIKKSAD